jgi:hypothetical protein
MRSNNLKNTIGGLILGFSLLFGIGIMSSMTAQAQYRNDDYYRRNRDYNRDYDRDQRRRDRYDRYRRSNSWDSYPNYGGSFELRQTALNAGYNEGIKEGRKDRNRDNNYGDSYGYGSYGYSNSGTYQRALKDYNPRLGDRYLYQQYFRLAFQTGYRDGLNGN